MTHSNTVDIQRVVDESQFSLFHLLVFGTCFLIILLDGYDTAAIGYIAPSLLQEWSLTKPQLAPVLSAALVGLALGSVTIGPLADRLGRKLLLCAAVFLFGLSSLISASAGSLEALVTWRFITGLGLGAAMPLAVTLANEFAPSKRRSLLTSAMFTGFPLGAAWGGFLSAWMIPEWGWRSVLQLGGVLPMGLALIMLFLLPESVRFMAARGLPAQRIRAVLLHLSNTPAVRDATHFVMGEKISPSSLQSQGQGQGQGQGYGGAAANPSKTGVAMILSRPYIVGSVMLWITYGMGIVIFYALINWMPVLLRDSGLEPKTALLITSLFPLGGVGAVVFGFLMDRFNANRVIMLGYLATAVFVYLIGQVTSHVGWLVVMVFVGGAVMNTTQTSMPALAAAFYPTAGRVTGVSWMMAIGRIGAVAAPFLVAELQRRQFDFSQIFMVLAIPGVIAAAALFVKNQAHPEAQAASARQQLPT